MDSYTAALIKAINQWGGSFHRPIDTVYLGGGTPSLLSHRLPQVLDAVRTSFEVIPDSEITLELNPSKDSVQLLEYAKKSGINRISVGAQSGLDRELKALGRCHTAADTKNTLAAARKLGFQNISLDLMLGLPDSNEKTLRESLSFIKELKPEHISAYILKIEERTAFYKERDSLKLPDDDAQAELYLLMCEFFEQAGYEHYEISNFCKKGFHSRHNLKYWQGVDYLGIGPDAHSCVDGERFYYPRDLKAFLGGNSPLPDGDSGGKEEYIMLSLRVKSGISTEEYREKFGVNLPDSFYRNCEMLKKAGLMEIGDRINLTNKGMLLSNSIITKLLECIK